MAFERARDHLAKFNLDDRIIIPEHSSATVEAAAEAIGCEPAMICKGRFMRIDINRAIRLVNLWIMQNTRQR